MPEEKKVSPEEKKVSNGLVIRAANGDLHFLRDEVLEATKITEPEMKKFMESVANEHFPKTPTKFKVNLGQLDKVIPVTGNINKPSFDMKAASTIMCPGVMKDKDFKVLPQISKEKLF